MIRDMKSSTGRWVGGADFFFRESELEIPAKESTEGAFNQEARSCLRRLYSPLGFDDSAGIVVDVIEIIEHDGYVEACDGGHRISSNLLRSWWNARFRDHHTPLVRPYRDDAHEVQSP